MKSLRPLFLFVSFVLAVGMACQFLGSSNTPAPQPQPPQQSPTQAPDQPPASQPTAAPAPTEPPPSTDTQVAIPKYFKEEFDAGADLSNWEYFTLGSGNDDNLKIEQEDDHLVFDLGSEDLYVYNVYTYDTYDDVTLTLNATNRGRNNNNISLVCRMNKDTTQWYEFSVESGGLWYLYAYDNGYNVISNGGTNALKQGKETNEYQMTCSGNEITIFVNGQKIKTIKDTNYGFTEGYVGFNISSLNVLPITVNVNWFEVSQP